MPPPIIRMSGLPANFGSGGGQSLVHDLPALAEADSFDDLIIVGKVGPAFILVPEGREEIVEVPREQSGGVRRQRSCEVGSADDRDPVPGYGLARHRALDI